MFHTTGRSPPGSEITWQPRETCCLSTSLFYFLNRWIENSLIGNCEIAVTRSWICMTVRKPCPLVFICLIRWFSVYSSRNLSTSPQAMVHPCPPLYIHTHADTPLKNHIPSEVRVHCKYSSSHTCPLITWEPYFYSTVRKPPFPLFCVDGVSVRISAELCRSE